MSTHLIQQLRKIFEHKGIPFKADDGPKRMSGITYYGLHKHPRCLYLTHAVAPDEFLQVHVPNTMEPTEIVRVYGVKGERDPENEICNFSHTYLLRVPITNGRINGVFSVEEKAGFFIDMARRR